MEPLVNILLPTFEPQQEHLREAIDSVLRQTEQRWTLFIHDDASTTDVAAMVAPYLNDPRIAFARSRKQRGIGGNWNAALRGDDLTDVLALRLHTSAPYVQFMFQDDRWGPWYLESTLRIMEKHPEIGCVAAQHTYTFEGNPDARAHYEHVVHVRRGAIAPGKHDGRAFLRWWIAQGLHPNIIGEPSFVLLCRNMVERTGLFAEHMVQLLDEEYWVRLLPRTMWYNLTENLGTFRVHAGGASHRNREGGRGLFERLCCFQQALKAFPEGKERAKVQASVVGHLAAMIRKFRLHRVEGGAVSYGDGGGMALCRFALRHPILTTRALRQTRRTSPSTSSHL